MSKPSRLNYVYAVGRVRALEAYLIQQAVFREAAETADFSAALKVIYDAGRYHEDLIKARNADDIETVLVRQEENVGREAAELIPEKDVLDVFLLADDPEKSLAAAGRSGYTFLREFVRRRIDLANIKKFSRARYLGIPAEELKTQLLRGGFMEPKVFLERYNLPPAELCAKSGGSDYLELIIHGTDVLEEKETFVVLERESENFLMRCLREARRLTFGPEPVFAYAEAKRIELRLIRLVGVGKFIRLPPELLKERISETYV
jgi:V/A-type H+-transporting ATPase subunit C